MLKDNHFLLCLLFVHIHWLPLAPTTLSSLPVQLCCLAELMTPVTRIPI